MFFDFTKENALKNEYPGQVGGFFFRNIYKYMPEEDFEKYTDIPIDDSGKLPIMAAIIAPVFRQDRNATFVIEFMRRACRDRRKKEIPAGKFLCRIYYIKRCWNN